MTLDELTALFEKLGAREPGSWARSQLAERTDQLVRFVFLREAWRSVVAPDDSSWIDGAIEHARRRPEDPGAGVGPALERLLALGADRRDLHKVVREMQYETLFSLCYLLEDPGSLEPEIADVAWRLVRIDSDGEVVGTIDGLHESVLETEPAGGELRPAVARRNE
jgi:hypothetical protein